MSIYFIIGSIILAAILLIRIFRMRILKWLLNLRMKLKIQSLRSAIAGADSDKSKTNRKNMVVFNTVSGAYEPLQKRLLKTAERVSKKKNNAKMTDYRKKRRPKNKRILNMPVKELEEKSLYVTK